MNGATSNEDVFDCPIGFEGDLRDVFTRDKIIRTFNIKSDCDDVSAIKDQWGIGASSNTSGDVIINNFHFTANNVVAKISNDSTFEILEQFISVQRFEGYTFQGLGAIDENGKFSVKYTAIREIPADTVNCAIEGNRK